MPASSSSCGLRRLLERCHRHTRDIYARTIGWRSRLARESYFLVNIAGNFFAGFFEELSPEQIRNQIETLLFGPMNVTRAVLPVMRKQRSETAAHHFLDGGHRRGNCSVTALRPTKFGIEGWMESTQRRDRPGSESARCWSSLSYLTELLTNDSTTYAQPTIDDYVEQKPGRSLPHGKKHGWRKQGGDPAKLDRRSREARRAQGNRRPAFAAGADAVQTFETKANTLLTQASHRDLYTPLPCVPDTAAPGRLTR